MASNALPTPESQIDSLRAQVAEKEQEIAELTKANRDMLQQTMYCAACGSCGETGCCHANKCSYLKQHQGDYDDLLKDNAEQRGRIAELEAYIRTGPLPEVTAAVDAANSALRSKAQTEAALIVANQQRETFREQAKSAEQRIAALLAEKD